MTGQNAKKPMDSAVVQRVSIRDNDDALLLVQFVELLQQFR